MEIRLGDILLAYLGWLGNRASARKYRQIYFQFFADSALRDKPAHLVTRYDMLYLNQKHESTPAHCNNAIGFVKQAYNWALDRIDPNTMQPLYQGQNPAWRITKHDARPRERVMDHSEIRALLASMDFVIPKYRAFFRTRLLAPGRIKELCEMRRDAVNLSTGKWFKRITKNNTKQYVLIPRQALESLRELPVQGDYFFMGCYGHPLKPDSARKIWQKLRADLGMPDVQLLDFRRTLATYLYTEIKADDLTAKAVLNHYDGRPVAVYTRLNYDYLAEIIQQYADWVWQFMPKDENQTTLLFHDTIPHEAHHATSTLFADPIPYLRGTRR